MTIKSTVLMAMLLLAHIVGCAQPTMHWLADLSPSVVTQSKTPVSVGVVVRDERRSYKHSSEWLALLPLVPYASGDLGGIPCMGVSTRGLQGMAAGFFLGGEQLNYAAVFPLLVSKELRNSGMVLHSCVEKNNETLKQHELVFGPHTQGFLLQRACILLWHIGSGRSIVVIGFAGSKIRHQRKRSLEVERAILWSSAW